MKAELTEFRETQHRYRAQLMLWDSALRALIEGSMLCCPWLLRAWLQDIPKFWKIQGVCLLQGMVQGAALGGFSSHHASLERF